MVKDEYTLEEASTSPRRIGITPTRLNQFVYILTLMRTTPATALLIAPTTAHGIQPFCDAHLAGLFARVESDLATTSTGPLIAQTLEAGTIRPLRPALTAAPSAVPEALPATFPIGNTKRALAAHAMLLALVAVPAVRLQHLLMQASPDLNDLESAWMNLNTPQRKTFETMAHLLRIRAEHKAFDNESEQHPMALPSEIFAVVRTARAPAAESTLALPLHQRRVVCLVNVSAQEQLVSVDWRAVLGTRHAIRDLVSGVRFNVHGPSLALQPYQVVWATL